MNIHLRIDSTNAAHTRFTVFLNGANCGQLCVTNEEFSMVSTIFAYWVSSDKNEPKLDSYERTGHTWDEVQQAKAALMEEQR